MSAEDLHFLKLEGLEPVAKGRMRLVFRHPRDRGLLVKVIRPEVIDQRWGSGQPWYKKRRKFRQYISYIRECEEYVAGCAQHEGGLPFAQKITGFVETDLGLGLVVEAALDHEGNLAPTLAQIVWENRFDDTIRVELETFSRQLIECDLIVADLKPANVVRAHSPELGHHFVMIDGLGISTVVPFKTLCPALNRLSKRGRVRDLWTRVERLRTAALNRQEIRLS
jgi:hypothetical protein